MTNKTFNIYVVLFLLSSFYVKADAKTLASSAGDYQLVWSDEFNGTSLNTKAWNVEVNGNGGGNGELQYYRNENVSVGNAPSGEGCLIITSKKESYGGKQFTSGRVNSMGKAAFKHGKIEARIRLPKTANGLWPAFWMMGNDMNSGVTWPYCGEMDILETGNSAGIKAGTQDRYFNGAMHWGPYTNGNHPNYAKGYTAPYSVQDGAFHLFTLVWTDTKASMYIDLDKYPDESPYFEMNIDDVSAQNSAGRYFHKQFFLLFNMAVGGSVPNIYNAGEVTALNSGDAKMYVDYVRVYQQSDAKDYTTPDGSTSTDPTPVVTEDTETKLGDYGSLALNSANASTFDFTNGKDYVLIDVSASVKASMEGKIKADYSVDDKKNFLYIWSNTYTPKTTTTVNSFGQSEAYNDYVVGTVGWSGLGYASSAGNGKDLSMLDDDYFLHFSMRGTDALMHDSHSIWVGGAKFSIGKTAFVDNGTAYTLLGDYKRDGRWCSFDIPVKMLKNISNPLFPADGGASAYVGNVFAVLSGGITGTEVQFDNIFFYKNPTKQVYVPTTDTSTDLGKYGYKSLDDDNHPAFNISTGTDYVVVDVSQSVKTAMGGKIKVDYSVDDKKNFLYVWSNTYTAKTPEGINSFGQAESFNDYTVNSVGWSGLGYASAAGSGKDLSMLDDSYYLHISFKGSDVIKHASHAVGVGSAKFTIGNAAIDGSSILGDFRRDGAWYSFDIPFTEIKQLSNPVFMDKDGGASAYTQNVVSLLSGGVSGTELQYDNVFFFKKVATGICGIRTSNSEAMQMFDMSGRRVTSMSRPGIYVIRQNDVTRKVVVR